VQQLLLPLLADDRAAHGGLALLVQLQRLIAWRLRPHQLQLLQNALLLLLSAAQQLLGWAQQLLKGWGCKGMQAAGGQAPAALLSGCWGVSARQMLALPHASPLLLLLLPLLLVCQTGRTGQ
jgi:hypothetical protein